MLRSSKRAIAGIKWISEYSVEWFQTGLHTVMPSACPNTCGRSRSITTSKHTQSDNTPAYAANTAARGRLNALQNENCSSATCSEEEDIIAKIIEHNGTEKGLLQKYMPVELMRDTLIAIHDYTGFTWAETITTCTILLKVAFVPLWAMGERARRNNAHLMPIAIQLQEKLRHAQKTGDVKMAMQIQRKLFKQMTRKTFIKGAAIQVGAAAIQGVTFAWVYGGLKMFAIQPTHCPAFTLEKVIWLDSLALPDPYYALPATLWVLMITVYELNQNTAQQMRRSAGALSTAMREQETREQKMKYFTRAAITLFACFSCSMTAGTFLYLIPSFVFQTVLRYFSTRRVIASLLKLPIPTMLPKETHEGATLKRLKAYAYM